MLKEFAEPTGKFLAKSLKAVFRLIQCATPYGMMLSLLTLNTQDLFQMAPTTTVCSTKK